MRKVDIGMLTHEDMIALLWELLDNMPESDALPVIKDWVKDNDLEGELG
jgi:hypothetical protein